MVDFSKLGKEIEDDEEEVEKLGPKHERILREALKHPEKTEQEIAEIADASRAYPGKVLRKTTKEQLESFREELERLGDISFHEEEEMMSVTNEFTVSVEVSVPRAELEDAVERLLRQVAEEETQPLDSDEAEDHPLAGNIES